MATERGKKAVFHVLVFLALGGRAGVTAQPSEAKFSVGGNTVARAGDVTYLFCNREDRTANPPSSYVWVKDGKVTPGHTRQFLTLSIVTRQDAGYYQCGTPDSSSYGQGVHLHVFVPGDVLPKPNLRVFGYPILGHNFSLYCHFQQDYIPSPATSYTWYKDALEVKGLNHDFLRFPNLAEKDQGKYTCTAREGPPETTSLLSIDVDLRVVVPAQVRIKPPGPVVRGVRGENLTLTCEVTRAYPAVPDDGYSWSYLPFPKGPQRPLEGKTSTLTLDPLTLEDRGQYMCQARNDQWYRHLDFTLGGNASVTVDVVYLNNLTLTPDLEVSDGDRVTLACAVDSRPTAQLTWTVHGQEVRHVTDNVDHYVISRAACSDSGSYTCGASNTELPGRDRHATLQLYVHCHHAVEMKVAANFNFLLPDSTPMVVVHPRGHDVISVRQDCSYNVSPAFQSRCLQPWCDSKRHRLSFTLTNVTEEDEGEYVCLEEGPLRRQIYNCSKTLLMKESVTDTTQTTHLSSSLISLAICTCVVMLILAFLVGLLLGMKRHKSLQHLIHRFMKKGENCSENAVYEMDKQQHPSSESRRENRDESGSIRKECTFNGLYHNSKVYIFPLLVPPKAERSEAECEVERENESERLLVHIDYKQLPEEKRFDIKDLLKSTLEESKSERIEDSPSFIWHNIQITKKEKLILVLDKSLGVVVMIVNTATSLKNMHSAEKAARHLVEARDTVRRKLRGLVTSGAVRAVLSLPCLTQNEAESLKDLCSYPDVDLLAGNDPSDFKQWAKQLEKEDGEMWESRSQEGDSPDSVYRKVASKFLTLAGCTALEESLECPDPGESLLLTPAQVEVRDSMARLLHVWGPPGSGKTTLLVHRARQWLAEGKAVVLAVGGQFCDIQLAEIDKAMRKSLREEICSRIRVCRTAQEMLRAKKDLQSKHPQIDVCVIFDILINSYDLEMLFSDVTSGILSNVWSAGWKSLHSLSRNLSEKTKKLGWESLHLPDCIRCTDSTVELLKLLGDRAYLPIPSCSVPRDQDIPAWRVVDHCRHPISLDIKPVSSCVHCKKEMATAFPSMKQGLRLSSWVALHTGDPDIFVNSEPVKEAAEQFGVPISYDSNSFLRHKAALSSSSSRQHTATGGPSFANLCARVMDGVDEEGQPTLHLLRVDDFKGMEREGVILVHWDYRDIHPGRQSQEERGSRLEEHRRQWILAVSRSTGQVILLLLSPSPARSLLGLPEAVMP